MVFWIIIHFIEVILYFSRIRLISFFWPDNGTFFFMKLLNFSTFKVNHADFLTSPHRDNIFNSKKSQFTRLVHPSVYACLNKGGCKLRNKGLIMKGQDLSSMPHISAVRVLFNGQVSDHQINVSSKFLIKMWRCSWQQKYGTTHWFTQVSSLHYLPTTSI